LTKNTSFDSSKQHLQDLLKDVESGKMQLPDFQRGWVWDDERIRSLLASVSRSFPIGAVMLLQTGNPDVRFRPRPVEGVDATLVPEPDLLILDGQQRLTSLFQALLLGSPVKTLDARKKRLERWYYIDIEKALDPEIEREEAIVALPADRVVRNFRGEVILDCSTAELEMEHGLFPLSIALDMAAFFTWGNALQALDSPLKERWPQFVTEVLQPYQTYDLPVITLGKETPKEAVCLVFEKVNTGGVALTVFELLTATFAAENFQLRDDWLKRQRMFAETMPLDAIQSDDFLQTLSLLASRQRRLAALASGRDPERAPGITCKRRDILDLTLEEYQTWADRVSAGYKAAALFLREQHVFTGRDLPYRTQLVPLAAVLALKGGTSATEGTKRKLAQWYWCGVLGELYGGAVETRFARDVPDLLAWIDGGAEPKTVADANFVSDRLDSLRTRNSAAYKGLFALVQREGAKDFLTGTPYDQAAFFDLNVDVHHLFPQAWCQQMGVETSRMESFVNKTPISAKCNRSIGGQAPSKYLQRIQSLGDISEHHLDNLLQSHLVPADALRRDDFDGFYRARSAMLFNLIESAMGKPIAGDGSFQRESVDLALIDDEI
jgi:hypothetical protein